MFLLAAAPAAPAAASDCCRHHYQSCYLPRQDALNIAKSDNNIPGIDLNMPLVGDVFTVAHL